MTLRLSGRAHRRPAGAGAVLLFAGALLSLTALVVALMGSAPAAPLALRALGAPQVIPPVTDTPVSTSSPPVALAIPAIAVNSTLEGLRLNADFSLQTPHDPSRAGWYADGPAPGDSGAAVVVGHLDSRTGPAIFWRLSTLLRGDRIYVRRADGRTLTFVVDRSAAFPRTDLPSTVVYGSRGPELHLLTCNGTYNRSIGRYDQSLVVIAKLAATSSGPIAGAASPPPPTATGTPPSRAGAASSGHRPPAISPTATASPPPSPSSSPPDASSPTSAPTPSPTPAPSPSPTPSPTPAPSPSPDPPPTPTPTPILPLPTPPPPASSPAGPPER